MLKKKDSFNQKEAKGYKQISNVDFASRYFLKNSFQIDPRYTMVSQTFEGLLGHVGHIVNFCPI